MIVATDVLDQSWNLPRKALSRTLRVIANCSRAGPIRERHDAEWDPPQARRYHETGHLV